MMCVLILKWDTFINKRSLLKNTCLSTVTQCSLQTQLNVNIFLYVTSCKQNHPLCLTLTCISAEKAYREHMWAPLWAPWWELRPSTALWYSHAHAVRMDTAWSTRIWSAYGLQPPRFCRLGLCFTQFSLYVVDQPRLVWCLKFICEAVRLTWLTSSTNQNL